MSKMVEEIHFSDDFVLLPLPENASQFHTTTKGFQRVAAKEFGITRHIAENLIRSEVC